MACNGHHEILAIGLDELDHITNLHCFILAKFILMRA